MDNKRIGYVVTASLMLFIGVWMVPAMAASKIGIAATVNDDVISTMDVEERQAFLMAAGNIPDTPENRKRMTPRVVQSLIDEQLQLQEAKRQSVSVTDEEVEKALAALPAAQGKGLDGIKQFMQERKLSQRTLENQLRTQLTWTKVVQRKLRRNVTVSQDEIARAQAAEAAAPAPMEYQMTGLAVLITGPNKEAEVRQRLEEIAALLNAGKPLSAIAFGLRTKKDVQFTPSFWANESAMPPEMLAQLKDRKPGDIIGPVRSGNSIQFLTLEDKRPGKKSTASTQMMIKQLLVTPPSGPATDSGRAKLAETLATLRANPGSCEEATTPAVLLPVTASFTRRTLGEFAPEQRAVLARLEVGQVSDPIQTPQGIIMVALCERSEPTGGTQEQERIRQQLFAEKIELEAQKLLRNLRREATLDLRENETAAAP